MDNKSQNEFHSWLPSFSNFFSTSWHPEISPAFRRRFSRRTGRASSSSTISPELPKGPISDLFPLASSTYCVSNSDSCCKYSLLRVLLPQNTQCHLLLPGRSPCQLVTTAPIAPRTIDQCTPLLIPHTSQPNLSITLLITSNDCQKRKNQFLA